LWFEIRVEDIAVFQATWVITALKVSNMIRYFVVALLFFSVTAVSQPLRDINYAYLYNPDEVFTFTLKPVRAGESFIVIYDLQVRDTAGLSKEYVIEWEGREMLIDKEGKPLVMNDHTISRHKNGFQGRATINVASAPKFVVAKLVRVSISRAWMFYTPLEQNWPVNSYLQRDGQVVMDPYIRSNDRVAIHDDASEWIVSYYDDDFPAAAPAFSEGQARVSRGMSIDSVFVVAGGENVDFPRKGLYLIQKDTTSLEGFCFRVEEDYPQYSLLVNLPGPLIYITTRREFERLETSRGYKKAFDRAILSITADIDRARILMRNYFRRVELANRYFTSYKEGWKTDRGMIYIVFGRPTEVFKFNDREVWNYKTDQFDIRFTFSKSSSLFDPDNYVLIREKKHEDTWYEVVDLWRKARF